VLLINKNVKGSADEKAETLPPLFLQNLFHVIVKIDPFRRLCILTARLSQAAEKIKLKSART
jgi:hypothetical protein